MNKVLLKPILQIRLLRSGASEVLFGVSCIYGRAKWVEETGILSIKLQVSEDAVGGAELFEALDKRDTAYDIEIMVGVSDKAPVMTRFYTFIPNQVELRSISSFLHIPSSGVWRYFIEGHAARVHIPPE